jgi:hypothetical protein
MVPDGFSACGVAACVALGFSRTLKVRLQADTTVVVRVGGFSRGAAKEFASTTHTTLSEDSQY